VVVPGTSKDMASSLTHLICKATNWCVSLPPIHLFPSSVTFGIALESFQSIFNIGVPVLNKRKVPS
jgi:hypothetical protein